MYTRIMVTLDRSALAEQALPHAVALARAFHAHLDLVAVVPTGAPEATGTYTGHCDWDATADESRDYLAGLAGSLADDGVRTSSAVLRGDVADEIIRHAQDTGADLLVMSTHGRSGLGRWVYGSIADGVLRHAPVPVLLIRAAEE